jgi:hypothetical protein
MRGRHLRSPGGPCRVDVNVWWKFIVAFYNDWRKIDWKRKVMWVGHRGYEAISFYSIDALIFSSWNPDPPAERRTPSLMHHPQCVYAHAVQSFG